jgi:hypothetical protein
MANSGIFFTPDNLLEMKSLVYRIKQPIEYRAGLTKTAPIKRVSAQAAQELWMAHVGGNFGRFEWNPKTLEFMFNGKTLAPEVPKAAANMVAREARFRMQEAATKLQQIARGEIARDGGAPGPLNTIDIRAFRKDLILAARAEHGANAALGRGGWEQMDGRAWDKAYKRLAPHLQAIDKIVQRVERGGYGININDGLLNHVANLANAGRSTYENTRLDDKQEKLGHDEFKRVLGASDNCVSARGFVGCIEAEAMGFVSREEFIELGDCTCRDSCNCTAISRRSGQDERIGLT